MSFEILHILGKGLTGSFQTMPAVLGVLCYVLSSMALYTMAQQRNIAHAWFSWVPVLNIWILGSLSDQYRYVVKGQVKSKRKLLLILNIISAVFGSIVFFMTMGSLAKGISQAFHGFSDQMINRLIFSTFLRIGGIMLIVLPLAIVKKVFRYMALYDTFMSCDPDNAVMYLVMSIFFSFLEPIFLFCNKDKERGMPPRKSGAVGTPGAAPQQAYEEPANPQPQQTEKVQQEPENSDSTETEGRTPEDPDDRENEAQAPEYL